MENRSLLPMISRKHKIDLATYPRRGLFNAFEKTGTCPASA
jgi:chloramphenicol O-acetyltransferase